MWYIIMIGCGVAALVVTIKNNRDCVKRFKNLKDEYANIDHNHDLYKLHIDQIITLERREHEKRHDR